MRFRKKPVVIDATQWDGTLSGVRFIQSIYPRMETLAITYHEESNTVSWWKIGTLEGDLIVSPNDWIICGVKGEYYPCKPDIFEATYEAEDKED